MVILSTSVKLLENFLIKGNNSIYPVVKVFLWGIILSINSIVNIFSFDKEIFSQRNKILEAGELSLSM